MYLSSQKRNVKNCVLISRKYILRKCFIRNYMIRLIFNDKNFRGNIQPRSQGFSLFVIGEILELKDFKFEEPRVLKTSAI